MLQDKGGASCHDVAVTRYRWGARTSRGGRSVWEARSTARRGAPEQLCPEPRPPGPAAGDGNVKRSGWATGLLGASRTWSPRREATENGPEPFLSLTMGEGRAKPQPSALPCRRNQPTARAAPVRLDGTGAEFAAEFGGYLHRIAGSHDVNLRLSHLPVPNQSPPPHPFLHRVDLHQTPTFASPEGRAHFSHGAVEADEGNVAIPQAVRLRLRFSDVNAGIRLHSHAEQDDPTPPPPPACPRGWRDRRCRRRGFRPSMPPPAGRWRHRGDWGEGCAPPPAVAKASVTAPL